MRGEGRSPRLARLRGCGVAPDRHSDVSLNRWVSSCRRWQNESIATSASWPRILSCGVIAPDRKRPLCVGT